MSEPGFLAGCRVAVLGLGLMGGSLALALHGRVHSLLGSDPDAQAGAYALREQIVERFSTDPAEILPEADLIILAAPVRAILGLINALPAWVPQAAVLIDLGSTKSEICRAYQELPERFDPLGGHPMCGKTDSGLAFAEAGLFVDAPFALTPLPRSSERARRLGEELVHALGARPLWLDAFIHDRWVASTSHLPYLVSLAVALSTAPDAAPMIGPGFRSATRLAASSTVMMQDVLATNRQSVLEAVQRLRNSLQALEEALASGRDDHLSRLLERGREQHTRLLQVQGDNQ